MKADQIKVVYLINGLGSGGAEMMLYRLLERIDRQTFKPAVIALLRFSGPLQEKMEALGVDVHVLGSGAKFELTTILKLYRLLKALAPDILHTQLSIADILGRVMGRLLKVPVIITSIRNTYYGGYWRNLLIKGTEKYADRTTFVCEAAAKRFKALGIVPAKKAQVIYNGLDTGLFYAALSRSGKKKKQEKLGLPSNKFILLAVGSLTEQKSYADLLSAFKKLPINQSQPYLVIAGRGPLDKELKARADYLGIKEEVLFLGRSDHVPELMAAADALVLSSRWEGLPGVVLEAMASELPVVATAVGGTPELVVDGETGYLVPAGAPEALAGSLEKLMGLTEEQLRAMGRAGRKRVEEHFHVDRMVKAYENLYNECMQDKYVR